MNKMNTDITVEQIPSGRMSNNHKFTANRDFPIINSDDETLHDDDSARGEFKNQKIKVVLSTEDIHTD